MLRFLPLILALSIFATIIGFRAPIRNALKKIPPRNPAAVSELTSERFLKQIYSATGQFDYTAKKAVWFNRTVALPKLELAQMIMSTPTSVLGETSLEKWIEIDLTNQKLTAHEQSPGQDRIVFTFPISSGLPWMPTVTGQFHLWSKVRSQPMTGGSVDDGTYYNLPNVPFVQYFYQGYGIHGAYWHNDFGKPRSHGCINLRVEDAAKLFFWTEPQLSPGEYVRYHIPKEKGTRVVVHGTTPTP